LERFFVSLPLQTSRRSQRGEGKLRAIIYTVILVTLVFLAIKLVPLYVAEYQLQDKMNEQAKFAVVNRYSEDQIRDILMKVIQDLDIPAKRDDIKLSSTSHGVSISISYTVPVDFLVYQSDITFSPTSEGLDIMK
jgi:cell division protein FtsL